MLPYSMVAGGRFTLTTALINSGVSVQCNPQAPPDFIVLKSITGWGEANDAQAIEWWWEKSMSQATAKGILQSSAAANAPALTSAFVSSSGISTFDTSNPPSYAAVACTAVTRGGAGGVTVVTMTNAGNAIAVGDTVRLYNVAGMQQISGMDFLVVDTTSTTSITIDLDSSGFAADGTTGLVLKYIPNRMYPRYRWVTDISKATQCVVDLTHDGDFTVGEEVSFRIPPDSATFASMQEIDNRKGVVTAVTPSTSTTCSKVTVDIDTSGFSTFTLGTSAQVAAGFVAIPSLLVPAGSGVIPNQNPPGMNIVDAFDNRNLRIINFGRGLFNVSSFASDNNDVWMWQAFKYDDYSTSIVS